MKLMLGNTPVKKMMIHNDTQDATMVASDLQAGVTCYAKGQKVTGTGKSFEFASYGSLPTNDSTYIPSAINTIMVSSVEKPVQLSLAVSDTIYNDFSTPTEIGKVLVDDSYYPIFVVVDGYFLSISCEKTVTLEIFYGKDNYV